jgi:hypothetical protein
MVRAMAFISQMGLTTSGGTGCDGVGLARLGVVVVGGRGIWNFCFDSSTLRLAVVNRRYKKEALTWR